MNERYDHRSCKAMLSNCSVGSISRKASRFTRCTSHGFLLVTFIEFGVSCVLECSIFLTIFTGLENTDMYGCPLVRRLIPCPYCLMIKSYRAPSMKRSVSMEIPTSVTASMAQPQRPAVYNFTLQTCAATAMNFSTIACPYHTDKVSLHQLIPDLLMADLPRNLFVDQSQFKFQPNESKRIGGGGAGEVFLSSYRNEAVAVKTFHSMKSTR